MRVLVPAALMIMVALFLAQGGNTGTKTSMAAEGPAPSVARVASANVPISVNFASSGDLGAVYSSLRHNQSSSRPSGSLESAPQQTTSLSHRALSSDPTNEELTAVLRRYCMVCHNNRMLTADLSLQNFNVAAPTEQSEIAEKVLGKLRLEMMPPPGMPRPAGDTLLMLADALETQLDDAAAANPNPGGRSFQRLNQAEYVRAVSDLLALEVDAGSWLPMDTRSDNFDNIADAQMMSPTHLDGYLRAAAAVSRAAVGEPHAGPRDVTFALPRLSSQRFHVEGTPYGTRGGTAVVHNFPADGEYNFRVSFYLTTHGGFVGRTARDEQLEISIDGERVALIEVDRFISEEQGLSLETEPIPIKAGPRRVAAAFIARAEGTHQSPMPYHDWSLASQGQSGRYGLGELPHLRDMVISGPRNSTGVSNTPARQRVFSCRPSTAAEERPCAEEIIQRLATQAFRLSGSLPANELQGLMALYELGAEEDGFEEGVRTALEAILASPDFVFRVEPATELVHEGTNTYRIGDREMASRLSFFLWSSLPDEELRELAAEGRLSEPEVLEAQVRRMLADPRSETLGTRFAAQWLRLANLDHISPAPPLYPDFNEQLKDAMRRETELFFHYLVQEDRNVLELWDADYTFVNEQLARHYGMSGVSGGYFRRVPVADEHRRGLLGHASILTLTSHANRTSPTDRGKWIMEVLLNSPPPPPPPGVPELDATSEVGENRQLTVRERMAIHRANPACESCHVMIDPPGLALENYDVVGQWRVRDNWMAIDSRSELWDGTPVEKPADLRRALLARPAPLLQTFTRNLMAYALGRRVEYYDMPRVREIVREAEAQDHRMSVYILGVVQSPAFQMRSIETLVADEDR